MFTKDLKEFAKECKEGYKVGHPFPHLVIDGLFDPPILAAAVDNLPTFTKNWTVWKSRNELKRGLQGQHLSSCHARVQEVLSAMNAEYFVDFLKEVVDVPTLQSDDTYLGGGIHQIPPGGKLGIHVDFSKNKELWRRANCLLYLNRDWKEEYGGHLDLYDNSPLRGGVLVKRVLPVFNRLVIFGTTLDSWHGHPEPLTCPPHRMRSSFATYYYSTEQGVDSGDHSTIWGTEG